MTSIIVDRRKTVREPGTARKTAPAPKPAPAPKKKYTYKDVRDWAIIWIALWTVVSLFY